MESANTVCSIDELINGTGHDSLPGQKEETGIASVELQRLLQRHLRLIAEYEAHLASVSQEHRSKVVELSRAVRSLQPVSSSSDILLEGLADQPIAKDSSKDMLALQTDDDERQLSVKQMSSGASVDASPSAASQQSQSLVEESSPSNNAKKRESAASKTELSAAVLWPLWRDEQLLKSSNSFDPSRTASTYVPPHLLSHNDKEQTPTLSFCASKFILRPTSTARISWDMLSLLATTYDVLTLPLQAFGYDKLGFTHPVSYVISSFWIIDIFVSFLSGYIKHGETELEPSRVAIRYVRTWFFPDLTLVVFDIMFLASTDSQGRGHAYGRLLKSFRLGRVMRTVRLLRIVRLKKLLEQLEFLEGLIYSEKLTESFGILKMLFFVMLINHFIACIWYWVGTQSPAELGGWVDHRLDDASKIELYIVSFHWSLAQFTPAPINFHPKTMVERCFSIVILVLGMVLFSAFLGSVTSRLTTIRSRATARAQEKELLRSYFDTNNVSLDLASRIREFLKEQRRNHRSPVTEKDIQAFRNLPETLLMALRWEVHSSRLEVHPLFMRLTQWKDPMLPYLCHHGTVEKVAGRGDELFHIGVECHRVVFVSEGFLDYFCSKTHTHTKLGKGQWTSEPVLWIRWKFQGMLTAMRPCDVLELDARLFHSVIRDDIDLWRCLRAYAHLFVRNVLQVGPDQKMNRDVVNDLTGSLDELSRIVKSAFGDAEESEEEDGNCMAAVSHFLAWTPIGRASLRLSGTAPAPQAEETVTSSL